MPLWNVLTLRICTISFTLPWGLPIKEQLHNIIVGWTILLEIYGLCRGVVRSNSTWICIPLLLARVIRINCLIFQGAIHTSPDRDPTSIDSLLLLEHIDIVQLDAIRLPQCQFAFSRSIVFIGQQCIYLLLTTDDECVSVMTADIQQLSYPFCLMYTLSTWQSRRYYDYLETSLVILLEEYSQSWVQSQLRRKMPVDPIFFSYMTNGTSKWQEKPPSISGYYGHSFWGCCWVWSWSHLYH